MQGRSWGAGEGRKGRRECQGRGRGEGEEGPEARGGPSWRQEPPRARPLRLSQVLGAGQSWSQERAGREAPVGGQGLKNIWGGDKWMGWGPRESQREPPPPSAQSCLGKLRRGLPPWDLGFGPAG